MKTALVVTTIQAPTIAMTALAVGAHKAGWTFIVVGDRKSPATYNLDCTYIGIDDQQDPLALIVPENHYARKNMGYLRAIHDGVDRIVETDDDNAPYDEFFFERVSTNEPPMISLLKHGWVNVYGYFTRQKVWPRGLPLNEILNDEHDFVPTAFTQPAVFPIQQDLADDDPDVDAVYRLTCDDRVKFSKGGSVALDVGVWSPFNSQATSWDRIAFPLLYMPSTCTFRACDIWRSFIAQRIAWSCGWRILFRGPTVYQDRNAHNLMSDFRSEIPMYLRNDEMRKRLDALKLRKGVANIPANLTACYEDLVDHGFFEPAELEYLRTWLRSINE